MFPDYLKRGAGKAWAKHINVIEDPLCRLKATEEKSPDKRGALLLVGSKLHRQPGFVFFRRWINLFLIFALDCLNVIGPTAVT